MRLILIPAFLLLSACARSSDVPGSPRAEDLETLRQQVAETERAFARTMAERDSVAFRGFLDDETVFFSGDTRIRGVDAVSAEWAAFFRDPTPPFSWDPDLVEVVESGTLALTSGPVYDPSGAAVARFNSVWRRHPSGEWKVVFDRGTPICACSATGTPQAAVGQ